MVVLKTNKDLYDCIEEVYGNSHQWLSGLAAELEVPYSAAEKLTIEAGFFRHRRVEAVSLEAFTRKPYAMYIIRKKGLLIV